MESLIEQIRNYNPELLKTLNKDEEKLILMSYEKYGMSKTMEKFDISKNQLKQITKKYNKI